jgi:hypothetical protein
MASRDYPTHAKDCPCSGCYASNGEQGARNKALEEAASICEENPTWTGKDLAEHLRGLKWNFNQGDRT